MDKLLWHMMAMLICCFCLMLMLARFILASRNSILHTAQEGGDVEDVVEDVMVEAVEP